MLKGTLIYELLSLPNYWRKVWSVPTSSLSIDKYKFGQQRRQYYLKVVGPESISDKVAIYLHGGGWLFGTPEAFIQNAMVFTNLGYTVYMPSYRRLPIYEFQAMYSDLKNALRHIKQQRIESINHLIIAGMSAGAHLGAILALDKKIDWKEQLDSKNPSAYIGVGAPLELKEMWQSPVIKLLTRKGYLAANPTQYLHPDAPTLFSLSAGKDGIVNCQSQLSFERRAESLGLEIQTHHIDNKSHMEIAEWSIPGNSSWEVVNKFLNRL